ncbi:MAG: GNAT family N-acetyltransferase [Thermoplasmata archaeon]|nr:GNAT family N-acetyltransferase [Thermoplasmata archaeon]
MSVASGRIEYRLLRRPDLPAYAKLLPVAIGELERATGLDQNADALSVALTRWPIWIFLKLSQFIGRPFLQVHVAADGPRLVGTATIVRFRSAGYVVGVATDPEYRGRGIASQLLERLRVEAVRLHRTWITLDTETENETALRVYRRAGYREIGRFTWFRRTGLPSFAGPTLPPATERAVRELLAPLDASRGADFRSALPANVRVLNHLELMFQAGQVQRQTWVEVGSNGVPDAVRAYFARSTRMGVLFPLMSEPTPAAETLAGLLRSGAEWLRPKEPVISLAVVPEPVGAIGASLEQLGFAPVVSSTTMGRPVAPEAGARA